MARLLFLAHRIPYPPNKGDKIRSWNILRHLTARHEVALGCFVDDEEDWQFTPVLREICAECHFAPLKPGWARLKSLTGLARGAPLSLTYYRDAGLARWVGGMMKGFSPEGIFLFSSPMAQYVASHAGGNIPVVMDFVDVDSDKWAQYAREKSGPARWVYRREARTLSEAERAIAGWASASVFVSRDEAALFRSRAPESADRIDFLNNGVDADYFSPDETLANPFSAAGPQLVFTGAMDYWANVNAVSWFAGEILSRVRAEIPTAGFTIVGGKPTAAVEALGQTAWVTVTGRVPDVRPYLQHAAAVVVPMRIARGIQNKVLEAMAMARPVIATPQAAEGIDARAGEELIIADGAPALARAIVTQLRTPHCGLGAAARRRVVQDYSWDSQLAKLDGIFGAPPGVG